AGGSPDRLRPRRPQDGAADPAGLRADARAEVGDRDGRLRELRRDVQQLHGAAGGRQDRPGGHPRPRLPAAARGPHRGHVAAPREGRRRGPACVPDPWSRVMSSYAGVPGVIETKEAFGETTLVVDPPRLVEACTYLRAERGFNFLSEVA